MAIVSIMWINSYFLRPFSQATHLKYVLGYNINLTTSSSSNVTTRLLAARENPHYSDAPHFA